MVKNLKIKGCPFCGGTPVIEHILVGTPYKASFIGCSNENCECAIKHPYLTDDEAVEAWNARIDSEVDFVDDSNDKDNEPNDNFQASMEKMNALKDKIMEKFGENAIWLALVLLPMMDHETLKFPEFISTMSTITELMSFLEQDEIVKDIFAKD